MQKIHRSTKTRGTLARSLVGLFITFTLSIALMACSSGSDGAPGQDAPAAGQRNVSGDVYDPVVAGASVKMIDANNGNGVVASAITNINGEFSMNYPENASGYLMSSGGTDMVSGLSVAGPMYAPQGSTSINPLTTLKFLGYDADTPTNSLSEDAILDLVEISDAQRVWGAMVTYTNASDYIDLARGCVAVETMAQMLGTFLPGGRTDAYNRIASGQIGSFSEVALSNFLASLTLENDGIKLSSQEANTVAAVLRSVFNECKSAPTEMTLGTILAVVHDTVNPAFVAYKADSDYSLSGVTGDSLHSIIYGGAQVNQDPVASPASINVEEDSSKSFSLQANDPDGTVDAYYVDTHPSHGDVNLDEGTGELVYTPDAGYVGADSFTFQVQDDDGALSNVATVAIVVTDNGGGGQASQYSVALESNDTEIVFYDGAAPYSVEFLSDFTQWTRPGDEIARIDVSGLAPGQYYFGAYHVGTNNVLPYWESGFETFRVSNGSGGWVLALTVLQDGTIVPGLQ